jgi:hypothetical protein
LRLQIAWKALCVAFAGLGAVSWALVGAGLDLSQRTDRHLLAGALANLVLVGVEVLVAATAYRRGERWAWFACAFPLLYGLPIMAVDIHYCGLLSRTVLPQLAGLALLVAGLLLPIDVFFSRGN